MLPATAASKTHKVRVTLKANDSSARKGERVWLTGKVWVKSKVAPNRTVIIDRRAKSTAPWKRYVTTKTRANGGYTVHIRPTRGYEYRARIAKTKSTASTKSKPQTVRISKENRPLPERVTSLKGYAGTAQGKMKTLTAGQRKATKIKKLKKVRYRAYSTALFVEVHTSAKTRTWSVMGKIRTAYVAAGGPRGSYGVPLMDAQCDLLEQGCVQRFSKGTLYSNGSNAKATGTFATGKQGEVIAAVRSQVGYSRRYVTASSQNTKFNNYMGSTRAWCSFLMSWGSEASGNGRLIPKRASFNEFKSTVTKTMKTGSTPKVGALIFMSTRAPANVANHVGLVVGVSGNTIRVVDGNTVGGLPGGHRGILERNRSRYSAIFYAYPNY